MLAAILSIINAIGSEVVTLMAVWLGWRLGASTQRTQRRLDALDRRFEALSQIMAVADNVPSHLDHDQLATQLETDDEFWQSMKGRLVRLFGLRRELVGWLDPAIVEFIDGRLRPLYKLVWVCTTCRVTGHTSLRQSHWSYPNLSTKLRANC